MLCTAPTTPYLPSAQFGDGIAKRNGTGREIPPQGGKAEGEGSLLGIYFTGGEFPGSRAGWGACTEAALNSCSRARCQPDLHEGELVTSATASIKSGL